MESVAAVDTRIATQPTRTHATRRQETGQKKRRMIEDKRNEEWTWAEGTKNERELHALVSNETHALRVGKIEN